MDLIVELFHSVQVDRVVAAKICLTLWLPATATSPLPEICQQRVLDMIGQRPPQEVVLAFRSSLAVVSLRDGRIKQWVQMPTFVMKKSMCLKYLCGSSMEIEPGSNTAGVHDLYVIAERWVSAFVWAHLGLLCRCGIL